MKRKSIALAGTEIERCCVFFRVMEVYKFVEKERGLEKRPKHAKAKGEVPAH